MGEARRRGTFEERKAQAVAEGRVKKEKSMKPKYKESIYSDFLAFVSYMVGTSYRKKKKGSNF